MDTLICYGGAVKALGDGRVGGYLVTFGSPAQTDTSSYRDFFDAETDFAVKSWPAASAVYYHHGMDPILGKRRLSDDGQMKAADEVGIWVEAQLAMRDEWERAVYDLAEAGKLSWSSGSLSHLVERAAVKAGDVVVAHRIQYWPLGLDASLTPTPAEPRCAAVALKSVTIPDLAALKAGALGDGVSEEMTLAALRTLNDRLFYSAIYSCLYPYPDASRTTAEKVTGLREAFDEFRDTALRVIEAILGSGDAGKAADAAKSLRALWAPAAPAAPRSLAERTELWLDTGGDLLAGYRQVATAEVKVGRKLSAARRTRLEEARQLLDDLLSETADRDDTAGTDTEAPGMGATDDTSKAVDVDLLKVRANRLLALTRSR